MRPQDFQYGLELRFIVPLGKNPSPAALTHPMNVLPLAVKLKNGHADTVRVGRRMAYCPGIHREESAPFTVIGAEHGEAGAEIVENLVGRAGKRIRSLANGRKESQPDIGIPADFEEFETGDRREDEYAFRNAKGGPSLHDFLAITDVADSLIADDPQYHIGR